MDAVSRPFSQIINGAKQFVIPVFQRDYSWGSGAVSPNVVRHSQLQGRR